MIQVYSSISTFKLYQEGKELCQKFQMSLSTKKTKIEYTKRIVMISGVYIKIADTKNYNEIITNEIEIPE